MIYPQQHRRKNARRSAFTLIELLVVIAIISILAAILFPVFANARDKARQSQCISNERQIGLAVQQYVTDNDERLFFRAGWAYSRANASNNPPGTITKTNANTWWALLMPYVKSTGIWSCPSDPNPTANNDASGNPTILRSYIALATAEDLSLAQLDDPVETMVVCEKWGGPSTTDSWIEPFSGDFAIDAGTTNSHAAANRHFGMIDCVFFDGHAKPYTPGTILASKDLTGCGLVYRYPFWGTGAPVVSVSTTTPANVCANFTWPSN